MARIEGPKYLTPLVIDLTPHKDYLYDIAPNGTRGARGAQDGLEAVLAELSVAIPQFGDEAELHHAIYPRIIEATAQIPQLTTKVAELEKALQVAKESLARLINNREEDISEIAEKTLEKGTKGKKTHLLAHFEKTIKYRSQAAEKAVKTRQKNAQSKNEGDAPPTEG